MEHQQLVKLADQHKKLLERYDVFPYEYHHKGQKYRMIHFYRLTNKLYGSYLYTPLDLSYEEAKEIFYHFLILQEYAKNPLSSYSTFASRDYSDGYYNYRKLLQEVSSQSSLAPIIDEVKTVISRINQFQKHLGDMMEACTLFKIRLDEIHQKKMFTFGDIEELRLRLGEANYHMLWQGLEQVNMKSPCIKIKEFLFKHELYRTPLLKELYDKTVIMLDPQAEIKLQNSIRTFGEPEKMEEVSKGEFIRDSYQRFEKYLQFSEDFIQRRVRNQSVQGRGK
jgi:hypothetical protein